MSGLEVADRRPPERRSIQADEENKQLKRRQVIG